MWAVAVLPVAAVAAVTMLPAGAAEEPKVSGEGGGGSDRGGHLSSSSPFLTDWGWRGCSPSAQLQGVLWQSCALFKVSESDTYKLDRLREERIA